MHPAASTAYWSIGLPSRGVEAKLEEPAQFMSQCQPGPHPLVAAFLFFENRVAILYQFDRVLSGETERLVIAAGRTNYKRRDCSQDYITIEYRAPAPNFNLCVA